VQGLTP